MHRFDNLLFSSNPEKKKSDTEGLRLKNVPPELIEVIGVRVKRDGSQVIIPVTQYREKVVQSLRRQKYVNIPRFLEEYALPEGSDDFNQYQQLMKEFRASLFDKFRSEGSFNFGWLLFENEALRAQYNQMRSDTGVLTHIASRLLYQDSVAVFGEQMAYELVRWEILQESVQRWLMQFNPQQSPDPFESATLTGGTGLPLRAFLLAGLIMDLQTEGRIEHRHIESMFQEKYRGTTDPDTGLEKRSALMELEADFEGIAGSCAGFE